jgi:hypothetical protein
MKALILALSLVSSVAMAETAKISIEGMHCAGCKEMITKKVCDDAAIKKTAESCEVKVTNADKQTGEITITTKGEEKVDVDAVKRQLAATGEGYKVANVEVKNMKNADGTPMTAEQMATATAATETKVPGTKTVTTTTTTETETVGADGKVEVKTETKVKKVKTASKTSTKKETK